MKDHFKIFPIGRIHNNGEDVSIEIDQEYSPGLLGIRDFSHLMVFYWFHQNDSEDQRRVLQVHPRGDETIPLTGVFGTHSPIRPNLIGITVCRILHIEGYLIRIDGIDAFDGSPLIDIKPYIPKTGLGPGEVEVPDWV